MSDVTRLARILGVEELHVRSALASAVRRSEPDAREVYGVINGRRFVARRAAEERNWIVSAEARPRPWESSRWLERAAYAVGHRPFALRPPVHQTPRD